MKTIHKITGHDAIRLARENQLTIRCHANPIDDGGVVVPEVAAQIATMALHLKRDSKRTQ